MLRSSGYPGLPTAAEMAACLRDPSKKRDLKERIRDCYVELRGNVPRPGKADMILIKKYSQVMSRLRLEEDTILDMLESFSRGDAGSVRSASSALTRQLSGR